MIKLGRFPSLGDQGVSWLEEFASAQVSSEALVFLEEGLQHALSTHKWNLIAAVAVDSRYLRT